MISPRITLLSLAALPAFFAGILAVRSSAETDVFFHAGPAAAGLQDVKAREFDLPGRQVRFEERHVPTGQNLNLGSGIRFFPTRRLGAQAEFCYNQSIVNVRMDQIPLGQFTVDQHRYGFFLSLVGRTAPQPGYSSLYGSMGAGWVYADYSRIAKEWVMGGQISAGVDFASKRGASYFAEIKYLWHGDVGDRAQSQGYRLKSSGNPDWNPANFLFGPHNDTQILGLEFGIRYQL